MFTVGSPEAGAKAPGLVIVTVEGGLKQGLAGQRYRRGARLVLREAPESAGYGLVGTGLGAARNHTSVIGASDAAAPNGAMPSPSHSVRSSV